MRSYTLSAALAAAMLPLLAAASPPLDVDLYKRASCGAGVGNCPIHECCSEAGFCGKGAQYCAAPACQIAYSNDACDSDARPCGASTADVARQQVGSVPYGRIITSCTVPKTVALTFDDGPYIYTSDMLDLLDRWNVKVTFFVTGNNLGKKPIDDRAAPWAPLIQRAHDAGHQIGSHTWSHLDLSAVDPGRRNTEMVYNEMAIRNVLGGLIPKYMRPPMGSCTAASGCLADMAALGYHVVNWDIDPKDYANDSPDLIQNAKNLFDAGWDGKEGPHIVLSHDSHNQTVHDFAEYMLRKVTAAGFRVVPVGECLGDPRENWYFNSPQGKCEAK